MGDVVTMTGRVLAEGEQVTETRDEQFRTEAFRALWHDTPDMVRYLAEDQGLAYPDAAAAIVTSLLREAEQAADKHDVARALLETVGETFFGVTYGAEDE